VVCRDDAQCTFAPSAGITGTGTLAAFIGASAAGTWQLCVGDSATPDAPTIDQVVLYVEQDGAYCGDGFVDAGEECDDGILDGNRCDGLCQATASVQVRIQAHCDFDQTLDTLTGAGCHDLSAAGQTGASAIFFDYLGGTAILYDTAGCTGQGYLTAGDQDFCSSQYPNGTPLNDRVRSVWLQ
jgi:hypothetical protein